jgi:hypothetical protein
MTSATKANAIAAPMMIPAIAPVDSFGFDEIDEEAPVGEVPVVVAEGAGVDTVKMDAELVVLIVPAEDPVGDTVSATNSVFDNCTTRTSSNTRSRRRTLRAKCNELLGSVGSRSACCSACRNEKANCNAEILLAAILVDALCCCFQVWFIVANSLIVGAFVKDGVSGYVECCILAVNAG